MTEGNKQAEAEEERLRNRLMNKKERRHHEDSHDREDSHGREGGRSASRDRKDHGSRDRKGREDDGGRSRSHDRSRSRSRGRDRDLRRGGPPPPSYRRGPPPPHMYPRGGPPPYGMRGPPPPPLDRYGRRPYSPRDRRSRSRSRSRSRDRSLSRSRSRSHSRSRSRSHSRSYSRSRSRSYSSRSRSVSDASDVSSRASSGPEDPDASLTKDRRTIFVSQLVMRADERDVRRYFRRQVGCKVNEVIMLRDKRTGRHKGIAYVELGRLEDVAKAVEVNGQAPDFQRFPILVKPSEAEKNYVDTNPLTASTMGIKTAGPVIGPNGKIQEAQKAYIGNLDPLVTQEHLYTLFKPFGQLEKVNLQMDPATGLSKGFAFLSYRDPKEANLAIQTLAGQLLAGKPLKTGWANQTTTLPNVEVVTSYEFPQDAPTRIQNAHLALAQLTGTGLTGVAATTMMTSPTATTAVSPEIAGGIAPTQIVSTAEAAINAALGLPAEAPVASETAVPQVALTSTPAAVTTTAPPAPTDATDDPKSVKNADSPTSHLLIRNMFDKDEETEAGWAEDIRLDFEDECSKYGKITSVIVMSTEPGGKIYASFETMDGAKTCASNLAGRWFDKRQLRVEFVKEEDLPKKDEKEQE